MDMDTDNVLVVAWQRNPFDITLFSPAGGLSFRHAAFFNQRWVQEALGVPLNHTGSSSAIVTAFMGLTGEPLTKQSRIASELVQKGFQVALVYGDRDYQCNCRSRPLHLTLDREATRVGGHACGHVGMHAGTIINVNAQPERICS